MNSSQQKKKNVSFFVGFCFCFLVYYCDRSEFLKGNSEVITILGRTRIFSSESPVSLIEENIISHLLTRLKIHHHIFIIANMHATYRHSNPNSMQDVCHMDIV